MHLNSLLLFDKYGSEYFSKEKKVLEIGPDNIPSSYFKRLKLSVDVWHTLELDTQDSKQTTYSSALLYNYPIPDSTYDIILAGQVMEHVSDIWKWLRELKRIVSINGTIILITPTSWPYHEAPIDCWRIYPEGMKSLAKNTDLQIIKIERECLERDMLKDLTNLKLIEGRSCFHDTTIKGLKKINFYNGILKKIPILKNAQVSTETAYDMITVLKKNT